MLCRLDWAELVELGERCCRSEASWSVVSCRSSTLRKERSSPKTSVDVPKPLNKIVLLQGAQVLVLRRPEAPDVPSQDLVRVDEGENPLERFAVLGELQAGYCRFVGGPHREHVCEDGGGGGEVASVEAEADVAAENEPWIALLLPTPPVHPQSYPRTERNRSLGGDDHQVGIG